MKHKLYVQPLMKFFNECIDFERTMEIDKQELVLQEDYSIYNVFKALTGPGKKFLTIEDLYQVLNRYFHVRCSLDELRLAVQRQFPTEMDARSE